MSGPSMVALIPARAGSKRCPGKNTRRLAGHPLLAYSIAAAQESGVFECVYLSSDDESALGVGRDHGARLIVRPSEFATDASPDIQWVRDALRVVTLNTARPDAFAILRPTSPFRTAATIQRAYKEFCAMADCGDSIRAVEPVRQHPGKMWTCQGPAYPIRPLLDMKHPDGTPWHSSPTQSLPTMYVQNSSLEMSWTANVEVHGTIHGRKVGPFFTKGYEGFAIDTEEDWAEAKRIAAAHPELLPQIESERA